MLNLKYIYRLLFIRANLLDKLKKNGAKISENVFIGNDCYIDTDWAFLLEIKEGAVLAARTMVILHDSCISNVKGKGKLRVGKIKIEERAYIGVNSTILCGVTIGKGSIIGANSLVNKNIPSNEVWAGVPIRYICTVDELIEKRKNINNNIYDIDFIGEIEKKEINYKKFKFLTIKKVKYFFEKL